MANIVVTLKIMPDSPTVDISYLQQQAVKKIKDFTQRQDFKVEIEPIAFGLKALKIFFVMDESKGGTELLEKDISQIAGINSVQVVDVRRTIG